MFIWASTAIKLIAESDIYKAADIQSAIEKLMSKSHKDSTGLYDQYMTVMEASGIKWNNEEAKADFVKILGLIFFSKVPVSLKTLETLLDLSAHSIISRLKSVLSFDAQDKTKIIRIFHTSFYDYLTGEASKGQDWFIDQEVIDRQIAMQCLKTMNAGLRFNICNIESSFDLNVDVLNIEDKIRENIPPHLGYSCAHWGDHLFNLKTIDWESQKKILDGMDTLLKKQTLYWFEVLSLIKRFSSAGHSLRQLVKWAAVSTNVSRLINY